jgi:NAD(P)-dependent dehydrogenase (short-subunit alcohol dehydrogenase family)
VTGSARGLGLSFVQELSTRPNSIVFAGVRSIPTPDSPLGQLAAKLPEVVIPIMITSGDEKDNAAAAETIKGRVGKVDVLISNAGMYSLFLGNLIRAEIIQEF